MAPFIGIMVGQMKWKCSMKCHGDVAWRRSTKMGRVMQRRKGSNAM